MALLTNVKPDYYLNSYVDEFIYKFNSCFTEVQLGESIGDHEYNLPLVGFKWLYRFMEIKGAITEIKGTTYCAQDTMLLDSESSIVFVVVLIYNMMTQTVRFTSHSYARFKPNGAFVPSSSLSELLDDYRHEATFNMINYIG
jgi:hypothetical protein